MKQWKALKATNGEQALTLVILFKTTTQSTKATTVS